MYPAVNELTVSPVECGLKCQFAAMASHCEIVLCDLSISFPELEVIAKKCAQEINRIEKKYSRYDPKSILSSINSSSGVQAQRIDQETFELLEFSSNLYKTSQGLFDITSGVLRKAWDFKKGVLPTMAQVEELLPLIGWPRIEYDSKHIFLPIKCMEIDFGGFGKEYAADRAAKILLDSNIKSGYINLAGDIRVIGPKINAQPWQMGIQNPRDPSKLIASIPIHSGALTTSGDYERFFIANKKRYCHIIRPDTGQPVNFWQSVSVLAPLAIVAGSCSTIAMLMQYDGLAYLNQTGFSFLAIDSDGQFHKK
jgi:thiamine biosynthesis lipoprotein